MPRLQVLVFSLIGLLPIGWFIYWPNQRAVRLQLTPLQDEMVNAMNVTDDDTVVQAGTSFANQEPKRRSRWTWVTAAVLGVIGLSAIGVIVAGGAFYRAFKHTPSLEISADASESERLAKIDQWLLELQQSGKFNGGVLIARDGKPLLMKTYGYADSDGTRLLTDRTPFRLASVSKQFTAAGILRLVENGHVELDQPVSNYLEDFPFASVTLRHLLNQTSGIPDVYMDLAEQHRKELGDVLRFKDVADLIRRYRPKRRHRATNTNTVTRTTSYWPLRSSRYRG